MLVKWWVKRAKTLQLEYFHLAFLLRMPKISVDFLIYKGLKGRSSGALIYLHRIKQGALTEFLLCYSIKHNFRNPIEAIMKNTAFCSERTHTDIKGNTNYFKHYTSANIFHIFSMRDHSFRDIETARVEITISLTRKPDLKLCTILPGVLFFNCILFVFNFRCILKSG